MFSRLLAEVRLHARRAFRLWQKDPTHPSLRFKRIHATMPIFAVRIGIHWRVVGVQREDRMVWFWIGSHSDYDSLVAQL